ncbi:MAG: hypothetical protein WCF33_14060 [Pseudonocardiaceae bacterium]
MRLVRDWCLVVVGVVLFGGAAVWVVLIFFLPSAQRSDASTFGAFFLALVTTAIAVLGWFRRVRRPVDPRPVDVLADLLAQAVRGEWRKVAAERVLMTPAPIPVGWSLSDLPVAGPVEAAVGDPDATPAFPPLPDQTRVTEDQLRVGGGRGALFAVYAGIASGRVVVVGEPGAGKTGSAVLLVLDALDHRDRVDDKDRARVPVPVLFNAHGWDPTTCSVQDWLAARLAGTYPLFQHRGGQAEATAMIVAGAVALVLDGLDEIDVARRPAALQALSDAPLRVVVFTRSQEMLEAAKVAWLSGAVALHLHDVTGPEGADYLQRARTGPPPLGWTELLAHLREDPDSRLTRGLSTPLALTLIRDTYRPGDDVNDLLTGTWQGTSVDLEQHLIDRVLHEAYTSHPGRPKPRYNLTQATQALAFLARQMSDDNTRDLGWWYIPRWASTAPRILASMIAGAFLSGILCAILFGLTHVADIVFDSLRERPTQGIWTGLGDALLVGLMAGVGVGLPLGFGGGRGGREPRRVRTWRAISLRSVLIAGLAYGFVAALTVLLVQWLATLVHDSIVIPNWLGGAVVGIVIGLPLGLQPGLVLPLVAALASGMASSVAFARQPDGGLSVGLVVGLAVGIVVGIVPRLAGGFVTGLAEGEDSPQGPLESWRNDQVFGLVVGLTFGLAAGFGSGLGFGLVRGLVNGIVNGLINGLTVGLVYGITSSVTWSTTLAWRLQLTRCRRVPAIGLMSFLEDARARGVLRTVGGVYQFRHATLQDKLAGQATAGPAAASAAQFSS